MQIYLPIAEISVNVFLILGMGGGVGFLSGLFGVGGGFLMTPLLMFIGVPPAVAVATQTNQIIASSVSGVLAHWKRGNVDLKMGLVLLVGGLVGSSGGVWFFTLMRSLGHIDFIIKLSYVVFLGSIGCLMLVESIRSAIRVKKAAKPVKKQRGWAQNLPFKTRFRKSRLYASVLLPLGVGFIVGWLAAIMGVGGGFVMMPAMIYLLGMPTAIVVGTSLFQIIFVTANVTLLQAYHNQTIDVALAVLLMIGGVIGAQIGVKAGAKLRGEQLRGLLALMVLVVCVKLSIDLIAAPEDLFSLGPAAAP